MKALKNKLSIDIAKYEWLYGDRSTRPEKDYVFCERLETRSPKFGWDIKPHIHPDILQVFFIEEGEFLLVDAENKTELSAPCLLFIPSSALHGFVFNSGVKGHILTMAESYFDSLFPNLNILPSRADKVIQVNSFSRSCPADRISLLIQSIDHELTHEETGKGLMLLACLQQLFLLIYRLVGPGKNNREDMEPSVRHFRKFEYLIRKNGGSTTLADLANEMAVTPVHLNRICKLISGKTASQVIQEYLVGQAKNYLTYTSYSVSEIAYVLNYEYPNYFARFFRNHTGMSPTDFRKRQMDK
ncbi:helix-turn-helix domain-containing protein [Dyadobacter diqingensis]|uniref:helix-turn-helix domain-containing protein n=1 Tax=Dyadobacter diqingensis TaxID=2938121 RepID=UPI0020C1D7DD|nr:helix-turn-helix domain-containing protein [Dyadobacter diqingensis]